LCCAVETEDRKIVIDPGLALGYRRHGLLPHPFQVAVGEKVRENIIKELKHSTDIVISHFHGDHVPLVDANPYQLDAKKVSDSFANPILWCKGEKEASHSMRNRRRQLSDILGRSFPDAEGKSNSLFRFSKAVYHGEPGSRTGKVMMTRIEDDRVFVHASDIQLLHSRAVSQILDWKPDMVLVSGPPLYLKQMSNEKKQQALTEAVRLSKGVGVLILDHHILRSNEGYASLEKVGSESGNKVMCAAEFMGRRPLLLEANRKLLYKDMPVPDGWHREYAKNRVDTSLYRVWQGYDVGQSEKYAN